ncbi:MAG: glycosyltransferase [Nitrospinota bacterium]
MEILCALYPEADLYTLVHIKGSVSKEIENLKITTSFLQKFPKIERFYRHYLPLMPKAIESFDLSAYDLVISTSHCVAKGVITRKETCHISYIHTPIRYAWDMYDQYFSNEKNPVKRGLIFLVMGYLRKWDCSTAKRVDHFVANSENISRKIKKYYGAISEVIYPPVDVGQFTPNLKAGNEYLIVSAFAPYKRLDIAIEAFNELGYPLKIIGKGQDEKRLKAMAKKNIQFPGWVGNEKLKKVYADCRALVFPGEEDFGIVPVEVQAAGRPVIAYQKGGLLETVIPPAGEAVEQISQATGLFFKEQNVKSLVEAVTKFERVQEYFDSEKIRENALKFDQSVYRKKITDFIEKKYSEFSELKKS